LLFWKKSFNFAPIPAPTARKWQFGKAGKRQLPPQSVAIKKVENI